MKVSAIMATYDKRDYLEYTLASLAAQTHADFELVLCDDGGVADLIAPYQDRFEIVALVQANAGRAAVRNTALAKATGDLMVFSDDDRILPPEFLAAHVSAHQSGGEEDLVVIGWKKRGITMWIPRLLPVDQGDLVSSASTHSSACPSSRPDGNSTTSPDQPPFRLQGPGTNPGSGPSGAPSPLLRQERWLQTMHSPQKWQVKGQKSEAGP